MLYCYNDTQSGWGGTLRDAANARGMKACTVDERTFRPGIDLLEEPGLLFSRVNQFEPAHTPSKQFCLAMLTQPGISGIQTERDILHYERKDLQARDFTEFMPDTFIGTKIDDALRGIERLGLPIVSKAAFGSSSATVRKLSTAHEAVADATDCLSGGIKFKRRGTQRGYFIWERFLYGNDCAYRVVRIGEWYWILRVHNRPGDFRASGSGLHAPVAPDESEHVANLFATALQFFRSTGTKWCGIDMLYDHERSCWQIVETTLAWNLSKPGANAACPVFDSQGRLHPRNYHGCNQFELLLDEIEKGTF